MLFMELGVIHLPVNAIAVVSVALCVEGLVWFNVLTVAMASETIYLFSEIVLKIRCASVSMAPFF